MAFWKSWRVNLNAHIFVLRIANNKTVFIEGSSWISKYYFLSDIDNINCFDKPSIWWWWCSTWWISWHSYPVPSYPSLQWQSPPSQYALSSQWEQWSTKKKQCKCKKVFIQGTTTDQMSLSTTNENNFIMVNFFNCATVLLGIPLSKHVDD